MKTLTHVVLPLVVLVGVVFGIAYISSYTSTRKTEEATGDDHSPTPPQHGEPLVFREYKANWDRGDLQSAADFDPAKTESVADVEIGSHNQYDFWFRNPNEFGVIVGLKKKSCTCAGVELGKIPEEAWRRYVALHSIGGWPVNPYQGVASAAGAASLMHSIQWHVLPEGQRGEEFPPAADSRPGVLRVKWDARQTPEPVIRLEVDVAMQVGDRIVNRPFSVSYSVVPPVAVFPREIELAEITPGSKRQAECIAVSTTREQFDLSFKIGADQNELTNPCFEVSRATPLSSEELRQMPALFGSQFAKMKPKGGYKFLVTVFESKDGRQLDIGPLSRKLDISVPELGKVASVPLQGLVRGDVDVTNVDSQGRISLGSFKADRGETKTVTLSTTRSDFDLKILYVTDDAIKAELTPDHPREGKKQWRLTVTVPPYAAAGIIPNTTAVVIATQGPRSRLLRVPISGNAYR